MSDPFAVRINFIEAYLKPLNASQQSVQAAVAFALRNFSACGDILWDCILEQCDEGNMNQRMNLFYFVDALCERCLSATATAAAAPNQSYIDFVARDLDKMVRSIVPEGRQGVPNRWSTEQILENWRGKRIVDLSAVDRALSYLRTRKPVTTDEPPDARTSTNASRTRAGNSGHRTRNRSATVLVAGDSGRSHHHDNLHDGSGEERRPDHHHRRRPNVDNAGDEAGPSDGGGGEDNSGYDGYGYDDDDDDDTPSMSHAAILRRMEEDRERHKRLREKRWVQPPPAPSFLPVASSSSVCAGAAGVGESTYDAEFEDAWETTSAWNEDDVEAVWEENQLCFPTHLRHQAQAQLQLSSPGALTALEG